MLNAGQFTNLLRKKLDVSDIDQYQIKRAYNNIVLTGYFMLTKDQEHTQNVQKVNLCSYYEIKRCGDGILDSED
ncbi:hypothetical protein IJM86_05675 [bacterium]|nr:hypothetical protein [bacterium]